MGPVQDYMLHAKQLAAQYGPDSCVLMQVGSFYELYGLRHPDSSEIFGSRIQDVANECDLLVANKGQRIQSTDGIECQVCMAGFGVAQLEKYVRKIQRQGFTCAIYQQVESSGTLHRVLKEIISPGTFIVDDNRSSSNIVSCVVLSLGKKHSQMSVSAIDLGTGQSEIHCFSHENCIKQLNYDDVDRCITIANPNESLLVSQDLSSHDLLKLAPLLGLGKVKCHAYGNDAPEEICSKVAKAGKQTVQRDLLCRTFKNMTTDAVTGWMRESGADLQSYVLLLEFISDHNPDLLARLIYPKLSREVDRLVMANHSLEQLNIIGASSKRHSSLLALIDYTQTPAGARLLRQRLTRPYTKAADINAQLAHVNRWVESEKWIELRTSLSGLSDFDRMFRLVAMGRFKIHHISRLIRDCAQAADAHRLFTAVDTSQQLPSITSHLRTITRCLDRFDAESCAKIGDWATDRVAKLPIGDVMFLKEGVCPVCDRYIGDIVMIRQNMQSLRDQYATRLASLDPRKVDINSVLKLVEKDGIYISGTQRRLKLLCSSTFSEDLHCINLPGTKSIYVLDSKKLRELRGSLKQWVDPLVAMLDDRWKRVCEEELLDMREEFHSISKFIAAADVIQSSCFVARKNKYSRPTVQDGDKSSLSAVGLRHPLIERINSDELYVSNDVCLGRNTDIMLLYGTNAVGKSSLIKSIGMCVCLAQAGMYVPCEKLELTPYFKMYTRILGNDDLFKGLSTFAVEMSELRAILHGADKNALVIGDELCSGTESSSATSIFAAGLLMLHKQHCSAIFATHFHEVALYPEVNSLKRLALRHMTVLYDPQIKDLVYDRKLRPGPGENLYGLEVCKALCLPEELLDTARSLRSKYHSSRHISFGSSRYNASKLKGNCELCGGTAVEVHHLQHQNAADDDGYIGTNHKNNCANLVNVCEACHTKLHGSGQQHVKRKTITGSVILAQTTRNYSKSI